MKTEHILAFSLGVCLQLLLATSCASTKTVAPYDYGVAVGSAAYLGYTHIAAKQDDDFRQKVAWLWAKVDAIDSTDNLAGDLAEIAGDFAELIDSDDLTEADKAALRALANMVLTKVDGKLADDAKSHPEAVEFLRGVRDGVDAMRALK
ncbi:MAG: hypothetical protein J5654_09755 [Victivallales bacterium]|nr:hypothetical protein [Victivallales bacterium]